MGRYEIAEEAVSRYGFTAGHTALFKHGFHGCAAVCSPFVQVLNNHSSHWVTVASPPSDIAADVILYDSL